MSDEIEKIAGQDEACQRLLAVPGVGSLVATALVASVRIVSDFYWEKLQSNAPAKLEIFSLVHHTHTTTTQLAQNAVLGNCLAKRLRWRSH